MGTLRRMIYITDSIGIERLNLKGKTNIIAHRAGPDFFLSKVQEHTESGKVTWGHVLNAVI